MKYFGGCDVGSTYTKAVILDETGKIVADTTIRSKIRLGLPAPRIWRTSSVRATAATRSPSRMRTSPRSAATQWACT